MKRLVATLALGATLVAGCDALNAVAQRQAFTKANFALAGVDLVRADLPLATDARADLAVKLAVENPNPVAAVLDQVDFQLFMDGTPVGTGAVSERFSVGSGETKSLAVPVSVPYLNLPAAALSAIQKREALFTLRGTSRFQTPLGALSFPVELSQTARF